MGEYDTKEQKKGYFSLEAHLSLEIKQIFAIKKHFQIKTNHFLIFISTVYRGNTGKNVVLHKKLQNF